MENISKILPQATDNLGNYLDPILSRLPERYVNFFVLYTQSNFRWRNWIVRGIFTIFMISFFSYIVNKGAFWLGILVKLF